MAEVPAQLQLHLEPKEPIEVYELTGALTALGRQYNLYVNRQRYFEKAGDARLLVSSVYPGSIDINFVPDLASAIAVAAPVVSDLKVVSDFAEHIKFFINKFLPGKEAEAASDDVTVRDCDDAINIVKPIAEHGGTQTINVYKGPVIQNHITIDATKARSVVENASRQKALLQFPQAERKQRVSMIWNRLDRAAAKTQGSSPDKGIIEEIDPNPKTILFTDDLSYLKQEMIHDEENPMQKVYFVDVEVSRVGDKVTAYRIVGFHGKDELPSSEE